MLRIRDVYPGSWFLPILDPGSRISDPGSRIPDLGSRISDPGSRIPDLGSRILKQQQKEGLKKISSHTFLCIHKFHKIVLYAIFEKLKTKSLVNFQRVLEHFTQKMLLKFSKIWDPGSIKTYSESRTPDPGSRGQKGTGSWIRISNTGYWYGQCCGYGVWCLFDPWIGDG